MKNLYYICSMKKGVCLAILWLLFINLSAERWIRINKTEMNLLVFDEEVLLASFPISCGVGLGHKQKQGDMRTPEGTFTITQIQNSRAWSHDFGDGKGIIKGAYGPWFFRLSAGFGIDIHGTHDPASMGKRASEGCIRLRNEDIVKLKSYVKVGTVVEIMPDR